MYLRRHVYVRIIIIIKVKKLTSPQKLNSTASLQTQTLASRGYKWTKAHGRRHSLGRGRPYGAAPRMGRRGMGPGWRPRDPCILAWLALHLRLELGFISILYTGCRETGFGFIENGVFDVRPKKVFYNVHTYCLVNFNIIFCMSKSDLDNIYIHGKYYYSFRRKPSRGCNKIVYFFMLLMDATQAGVEERILLCFVTIFVYSPSNHCCSECQ